jgi:hypothetical protein
LARRARSPTIAAPFSDTLERTGGGLLSVRAGARRTVWSANDFTSLSLKLLVASLPASISVDEDRLAA